LPYDPTTWFNRGAALARLGYPELCVGDLHKARLLVEAALSNTTELGQKAILVFGMSTWLENLEVTARDGLDDFPEAVDAGLHLLEAEIWTLLAATLGHLEAVWDLHQLRHIIATKSNYEPPDLQMMDQAYRKKRQFVAELGHGENDENLRAGSVYWRAYPWMTTDMLHRRDCDIEGLTKAMKHTSHSRCELAKSSIQDGLKGEGTKPLDIYGVVATAAIRKGETVLVDSSMTAVTTLANTCKTCLRDVQTASISLECCAVKFCSQECACQASDLFHGIMCGKKFNLPGFKLLNLPDKTRILHRARCLAIIVQADKDPNSPHHGAHPLYHPLVSCLTPNYKGDRDHWSYYEDVVYTIQTLQTFGVDIFADLRYDTWVMQTMRYRFNNNAHGSGRVDISFESLNTLHALFNHNCLPNVDWKTDDEKPSAVILRANRDIKAGEELFIEYMNVRYDEYAERQAFLKHWFGGDCGCERCRAERPGADPIEKSSFWLKNLKLCSKKDRKEIMRRKLHK
jgi:hypothetical protein